MKILFFFLLSIFILIGCGKKSDPQYQGKSIKQEKIYYKQMSYYKYKKKNYLLKINLF